MIGLERAFDGRLAAFSSVEKQTSDMTVLYQHASKALTRYQASSTPNELSKA